MSLLLGVFLVLPLLVHALGLFLKGVLQRSEIPVELASVLGDGVGHAHVGRLRVGVVVLLEPASVGLRLGHRWILLEAGLVLADVSEILRGLAKSPGGTPLMLPEVAGGD